MADSYREAMNQLKVARLQYELACLAVWRAAEREHPQVVSVIRSIGSNDIQAGTFLCAEQPRWGAAAADLLAAGREEDVVRVLEQALAGVF